MFCLLVLLFSTPVLWCVWLCFVIYDVDEVAFIGGDVKVLLLNILCVHVFLLCHVLVFANVAVGVSPMVLFFG